MADRFAKSNNMLIQSLKDNAKNKNRQQSKNNWINVWSAWAEQKGHNKCIEGYKLVALNKIQPRKAKWKQTVSCLSEIFVRILLTSNHIFLMQSGINKHLQIFQRPQIALVLWVHAILLVFEKFTHLFQIALKIMWLPIQMNLSPIIRVQCLLHRWVLFFSLGNNFVDMYLFNIEHLGRQIYNNNDHYT